MERNRRLVRQNEEFNLERQNERNEESNFRNNQQPPNISFTRSDVRFRDFTDKYTAQNINFTGDWNSFMREAKSSIVSELENKRDTKIFFSVNLKMRRSVDDVQSIKNVKIKESKVILRGTNLNELYDEIMEEINSTVDMLQDTEGSGWIFEGVENVEILTVPYEPLRGSKWLPLPKHIADKKAVINLKNNDEECFKWCIAREIQPTDTNPQRIDKKLREVAETINMEGISSPTKVDEITKFEEQNPDIAVVVLALNEKENVVPIRQSKYSYKRKYLAILLLITNEEKDFHYTLVKSQSKLIASQFSNQKKKKYLRVGIVLILFMMKKSICFIENNVLVKTLVL